MKGQTYVEISIIIPVYNKAKYLETAMKSALSQDFARYEVIAVDDGSTDGSSQLCDSWAAKDSRLRVVHQTNSGVTAARKAGLAAAQGRYVMFADADDQLLPNALSATYQAMTEQGADEVIGGFTVQNGLNIATTPDHGWKDAFRLIDDILGNRQNFPILWAILYKKDLLAGCFDIPRDIPSGEDKLSQIQILLKRPKVYTINSSIYVYNAGIPNQRRRTTNYERKYDQRLRAILQSQWERFSDGYHLYRVKTYEAYLDGKHFEAFTDYYHELRQESLSRLPLQDRLVVFLPPRLAYWLVHIYKQLLRWKSR